MKATKEEARRGYIGLSVRCGIDFIEARGLTGRVRAPARSKKAIRRKPLKLFDSGLREQGDQQAEQDAEQDTVRHERVRVIAGPAETGI